MGGARKGCGICILVVLAQISVPHYVADELAGPVLQVPVVNRYLIASILFEDSYDTDFFLDWWYKCRGFFEMK